MTFGTFGDPWKVQRRFLIDFGCFLEALWHIIFEKMCFGHRVFRPMFMVSFLDSFLMAFGCCQEPPDKENPLKFMQLSSKIRVRRIAAKVARGCCQGRFFMDFGAILGGSGIVFFICWGLGERLEIS